MLEEAKSQMSVREKSYKNDRRRNFTWKIFCDWKFLPANFCTELQCSLSCGQKISYSFVLEYNFSLLGENSTCLIKTWWVIARLPASSLTAPGYHQLAALVHCWQAAAGQPLPGGLLYLATTRLNSEINGKRKGETTPKKQSLKSDRTDISLVVWKCNEIRQGT